MKLLKMMQERERFSPTEQLIVDYVLANYQKLPELSARQLAEKAYTSSAAVVRFCQRLGLKGYADFKLRFVAEAMQSGLQAGEPQSITRKDTILSAVDKVTSIELGALQDTRNDIDPAVLMRTVHWIDQADCIDFYAIDNNVHLAEIACYSFLHAGKFATAHRAATELYLQAVSANKHRLAFLISRTGENRRLIDIAEALQERKCRMILLTAAKQSTLASMAEETLCAATEHSFNELENFVFLLSAKYMLDIIFSILLSHHYDLALERNAAYGKFFSRSN